VMAAGWAPEMSTGPETTSSGGESSCGQWWAKVN